MFHASNARRCCDQSVFYLDYQKRIPPIVLIQIANGGGDAQGNQRGKEYDNMSGLFAQYIWPFDPKYPDGAWGFHKTLIPNSEKKPIRLFISVGDRDLLSPNVMRDGMHDWVEANHRMAKALKAKGYEYQYIFCRNSGHSIDNAKAQFLPHAIEWVWRGYGKKKIQ